MLAFDPASYGITTGVTYGIDQYDPGFTNNTIGVSYHPSDRYSSISTPYGYLRIQLNRTLNLRPGQGRAFRTGSNAWGGSNYVLPLNSLQEVQEVTDTLRPGSQLRGAPHLSMLVAEGMIPSGLSSTPRADQYRTQGLISSGGVDISEVRQQQMINDFIFGRITSRQLADFYNLMIAEGAVMSDNWYGGALSGRGMLFTRTAGLVNTTPTITFQGAPPVSAPSGGTTLLPPVTGGGTIVNEDSGMLSNQDGPFGDGLRTPRTGMDVGTGAGGASGGSGAVTGASGGRNLAFLILAAVLFYIFADS